MKSSRVSAVILCGGKGVRSGSKKNKVLCYFGVKTALEYCLDAFTPLVGNIIIVAAQSDKAEICEIAKPYGAKVVLGGDTRTQSVASGLAAIEKSDIVLIHDAARPFVSEQTITDCIKSASELGSGIAAVKVTDTVKRVKDNIIVSELNRDELYNMQTPQAFRLTEIKKAYNEATGTFTDDSAVYAAAGFTPRIVLSSVSNKKITTPEDLISTPPCNMIGTGVDFHTFAPNRRLIIGGVHIPYESGLIGNSDADVLTHAIMDALLSAIGEPDIGVLFPCTDEFKDADSIELLKIVTAKVEKSGHKIINVSATIMAEAPKMKNHIPLMRKTLAVAMNIAEHQVNISATTTEGLGVIGEGKGIASSAVCLLQ